MEKIMKTYFANIIFLLAFNFCTLLPGVCCDEVSDESPYTSSLSNAGRELTIEEAATLLHSEELPEEKINKFIEAYNFMQNKIINNNHYDIQRSELKEFSVRRPLEEAKGKILVIGCGSQDLSGIYDVFEILNSKQSPFYNDFVYHFFPCEGPCKYHHNAQLDEYHYIVNINPGVAPHAVADFYDVSFWKQLHDNSMAGVYLEGFGPQDPEEDISSQETEIARILEPKGFAIFYAHYLSLDEQKRADRLAKIGLIFKPASMAQEFIRMHEITILPENIYNHVFYQKESQ